MLILDSTSDVIKLITGSAGAIDVHGSYMDVSGSPQVATPGSANIAQISTAATTNIVAAPGASTQRNVKHISIRNASTTSSNNVTVEHFDGTNTTTLVAQNLYPGDSLTYDDMTGWKYNPGTNSIQVPGRLISQSTTTSASGSFTTGHYTNLLRVICVGAGGGGGGCSSVASAAGAAGGGGGGGYTEKLFVVQPDTAYSFTCGAAGTGVSGAAGNNGGDTTFTGPGGLVITAKGGTGGPLCTSSASAQCVAGGAGGVVGSNGDINASGMPGGPGAVLVVATAIMSGNGGDSIFGCGGLGLVAAGAGNAGTGNGSGGGGAATGASTARAGGNGTGGMIFFEEYT